MTGKRGRSISESSNGSSDDSFSMGHNSNDGVEEFSTSGSNRRRARGPSKRPCLNKNALMARQNRQKKKEHMENMENQLNHYRRENKNQSNMIQQQTINLKRLAAENTYLRSVLKNKTTITSLLSSMNKILNKKKSPRRQRGHINDNMAANVVNTFSSSTRPFEATNTIDSDESENEGKLPIFTESNHTYDVTDDVFDIGAVNCDTMINGMELDSNSRNSGSSPTNEGNHSPSSIDLGISDPESDELHPYDQDLFGDFNVTASSSNLFDSLNDAGVCFHVNSGKISMEFCSICHLNSIHSDEL